MKELTDEQVEQAAEASIPTWSSHYAPQAREEIRRNLRVAAPFLQAQWKEPDIEEVSDIYNHCSEINDGNLTPRCIKEFVRRRNATLLPKPVDPRKTALLNMYASLRGQVESAGDPGSWEVRMVDRILNAIDEVKS